ncbi:hypothetical protein CU041_04085 [Thalassospira povalilytica]|jgi:hypothetical protein|uniref:Uncharacterized protein n=1 Tax=Thalassospira povalilytica TaxID=732237 RepID=A0ABX4REP3_9PROT|nr:hypothetical protein CU041_04085 [Thalassospira povalilytica]
MKMARQCVQITSSPARLREKFPENSMFFVKSIPADANFVIFRLPNDAIPDNKIVLERSFKLVQLASCAI